MKVFELNFLWFFHNLISLEPFSSLLNAKRRTVSLHWRKCSKFYESVGRALIFFKHSIDNYLCQTTLTLFKEYSATPRSRGSRLSGSSFTSLSMIKTHSHSTYPKSPRSCQKLWQISKMNKWSSCLCNCCQKWQQTTLRGSLHNATVFPN